MLILSRDRLPISAAINHNWNDTPSNCLELSRYNEAHVCRMEVTGGWTWPATPASPGGVSLSAFSQAYLSPDSESVGLIDVRAWELGNSFQCLLDYSPLMSLLSCSYLMITSTINYKVLIMTFAILWDKKNLPEDIDFFIYLSCLFITEHQAQKHLSSFSDLT